MLDDVSSLKTLGSKTTEYSITVTPSVLETFPNAFPENNYIVTFETEEISSLCPKTNQPDFGKIQIRYIPNKKCIESKSLKLYLFSYRNEPTFMETLTNRVLGDLTQCCSPKFMEISTIFNARGGIVTKVCARVGAIEGPKINE